ncbi:GTPase [Aliiruegeria lutimaris]|uniref:50S ribosome-binding GTPase n=1 Tax=Aliiruegeria lutimaris TaxID=571298 RepID=A0A1G9P3K6_9RHOB|nr:GTPase domain-containing protein [Aliiruegeria lutimaris]SDL93133.1 50S ribosome-binding GTPase [Aliiruegeria lutimaris]
MEFDFSNWKAGSSTRSPKSDAGIWEAVQSVRPVIWLLGKTGAGKTSLVSALTGLDTLEIGNGFVSCTKQSMSFDYPHDSPLFRFLDTRGLGEVGYDPHEDIAQCAGRSHALLVVARKDDPVQGEIAEVLADILAESPQTPVGVVHTGADLIDNDQERQRARLSNQKTFEKAAKTDLPSAQASLGKDPDTSEVLDLLSQWLPLVAYSKLREDGRDAESFAFKGARPMILKFATAAGAVDVAPAVGLIGVPAIQGTMLSVVRVFQRG